MASQAAEDNEEPLSKAEAEDPVACKKGDQVEHWVLYSCWPKEYCQLVPEMAEATSLLRERSDPVLSYTESVEKGDSPPAYSPAYEETLTAAGIFMHHDPATIRMADSSEKLRATLRAAQYDPPQHSLFHGPMFWKRQYQNPRTSQPTTNNTSYLRKSPKKIFTIF